MLNWKWVRFADLGVDDLYDALALRSKIFVVEQDCIYLDIDGLDRQSWHLVGRDGAGVLQAYLRVVDPGLKYEVPSIGRVTVDESQRGTGLGHALVDEALRRCNETWPGRANHISAQSRLKRFYAGHGFMAVGDEYLEDGIPHIGMEWAPA